MVKDPAQSKKPRYEQIADELRARIEAGDYAETGKLPSERVLTEEFDAARNTIRDALQLLRVDDLIESRGGSGVYLRTFRRIARDSAARLSREHWGAGRAIWDKDLQGRNRSEDVTTFQVDPPEHVAQTLGVPGMVWCRDKLYRSEGRIVMHSAAWYPADLAEAAGITGRDTGPGGTYARLEAAGRGPARFREEIEVRLPLSAESKRLAITMSTPIILIVRTAYDSDDRPIEVNEMKLDSDSYRLIYNFSS
ncbi:GntR family transcriptional regulator [Streptomyces sp. B21-101]|jgi:GntR family transcriptional regulator|uniref:GntR family transcriptional regulator n=1 Tax=Streptomyces sp. B21-101 TaxID=3039415 RepID=UPI002FEEC673